MDGHLDPILGPHAGVCGNEGAVHLHGALVLLRPEGYGPAQNILSCRRHPEVGGGSRQASSHPHAHAGTAHPWHGGTADHEVPSQQVLLLLLAMLVGLFPFHLDGGSDGGRRVRLDAGGGSSDFLLVRRHGGFVLDGICLLDGHRGGV
jgi:hypothetical protein